ncbi:hypothetical protein [Bradyrhizobium sp. DASA03120]|uniref:hypothetical protein n=1 Tax=Bradyrhizobium sp. SMVTL-02 TaxID=3395917 RepID=UPI003F6FBF67
MDAHGGQARFMQSSPLSPEVSSWTTAQSPLGRLMMSEVIPPAVCGDVIGALAPINKAASR